MQVASENGREKYFPVQLRGGRVGAVEQGMLFAAVAWEGRDQYR